MLGSHFKQGCPDWFPRRLWHGRLSGPGVYAMEVVLAWGVCELSQMGGEWELQWESYSLHTTQQWCLASAVSWDFFLQNFSVVELLIPITSGCLLQPKAVPYLDPCSKPHFPTPPLQYKTHNSGQVVSGLPHRLRVQFLICTAFHRLSTEFSFDLLKVPFCLSWFPHHEGVFLNVGPSSHLQFPTRVLVFFFFLIPLFFFSFFCLTWLRGNFSCPFRCPKSSVNVQQVLCENCSICKHILFFFNCIIITLECCVRFFCTTTWTSHIYVYVPSLLSLPPLPPT